MGKSKKDDCNCKSCKDCAPKAPKVEIKILEKFEESFDIKEMAKYLGWQASAGQDDTIYISREKFPRTEINITSSSIASYFAVALMGSKKRFLCSAILQQPLKMECQKFQRIKKGKQPKTVKLITVFYIHNGFKFGLIFRDESHGFDIITERPISR